MKTSTIVITGGAGFIGSYLCERLWQEGNNIICIDNLSTSSIDNLSSLLGKDRFRFIMQDVTEYIDIKEDVDYILHFASPASPIDYLSHPIDTLKAGSQGTCNVLGLAKSKGAHFLLASTSEIYGNPLQHPQREDYWGNVNPIGLRSVYDEAKRFSEALTCAYQRRYNLEIDIVRIFNTYGPRMRQGDGRAVPNFITQALSGEDITVYGDGTQTRSFCYIDDLIEGIIRLLYNSVDGPVNMGNPEEITIKQLALKIIEETASPSKIVYKELPRDDPQLRRPDINKARALLKWTPRTELSMGLKNTIEWFRKSK